MSLTLAEAIAEAGDSVMIEGLVVGNGHSNLIIYLPFGDINLPIDAAEADATQWNEWLKNSDDPKFTEYTDESRRVVKAIVRKATRQVDEGVKWQCYKRDNYTCVYCGIDGVPMTYDHFLAQDFGGPTTVENGRTSCRRCNKKKANKTIEEWKQYAREKGLNGGENLPS